ncbi:MAG: hypothetical protein KAS04_04950 [Candidatus Aenigmarchaeota archaeon]|nr:hypothetical protein [Candidatus Aenigmarchaeota archaeon]
MDTNKILFVNSKPQLELDIEKYGIAGIANCYKDHDTYLRLNGGMEQHHENVDFLKRNFISENQLITREDFDKLTPEEISQWEALGSLGGDNHFIYVAHFAGDVPVIGINSKPDYSKGNLLYFKPHDLDEIFKKMKKGDYSLKEWTKAEAEINGKPIDNAVAEYAIGELNFSQMTKYKISYRGNEARQSGSGILVVTPAGTRPKSWYYNYLHEMYNRMRKQQQVDDYTPIIPEILKSHENALRFLVMVPAGDYEIIGGEKKGEILPGEELKIISTSDSRGVIIPDSDDSRESNIIDTPPGSEIKIRPSNDKLKVVKCF